MKLSVVIVNYNVRHFLQQCLNSVYKAMSKIDAEVFVVDNNSVDGSVAMVKERFPEAIVIANTENVGFSVANNQAITASTGEYVLLLNPDTVVPENCFNVLIDFMDNHPDAGACGARMIDGQGKFLPESKRGLPTPEVALYKMLGLNKLFSKSKKFGKYHMGYLDEFEINEVDVLAGAFMLMRKSVLDEIGLLDETFFMYGEDIDLSYRITQAGYKNYYHPETTIIHYKGESTKKRTANYVKIFYKAMIIFAEKHYKGRYKHWFTLLINTAIYLRAGIAVCVNFVKAYWMVMFETLLIFGGMVVLKNYWEEHIKYIKAYPREMLTIHLPYYTITWVLALGLSGSYGKPFQFNRLVRGMLIGTAVVFMIYGLLPDHLHFSRGIILFGALLTTALLVVWRTAFHLAKYKTLDFSLRDTTKSILVGSKSKWNEVTSILNQAGKEHQRLGFVSTNNSDDSNWLGVPSQLGELVEVFGVNEIVFSADSMDAEDIIKWMHRIGPEVNYYTIPENSDFVIGSHSKNSSGFYFGQQIELNLSKPEFKKQKRLFDFISAVILLVLSPLLFWLKPSNYFNNALQVLSGKKTWVAYSDAVSDLPALRSGVLRTDNAVRQSAGQHVRQLDKLYAKNYDVGMDLHALFRYLFKKS